MRICDLTHAYTDTSGGIRTTVDAKRAYILDHTDWEHVLIAPGPEDAVELGERTATIRVAGPVIPGAAPYRFFSRTDKLRAALRRAHPDLIELHTFYTSPWAAFAYRKKHPAAITAFYHTDLPSAYVEPVAAKLGAGVGRWAKARTEAYVRRIFDRCDHGFAVSDDLVGVLEQMGVQTPLDAVPLGVDLDLFHPSRRDPTLRRELGVADDALLLAYAGRLDSEKEVSVLADAVELVDADLRPHLVLAGQGPHRERLKHRAAGSDRLTILPYVGDKLELARLLASSDVYVTAGPHETFGLSVVEAQACGLPVVGVAAGALLDRVPEGAGLLGAVGDADAFARNTERVAFQRTAFGQAGRALVEGRFSWNRTFERLFDAYSDLIKHRPLTSRTA